MLEYICCANLHVQTTIHCMDFSHFYVNFVLELKAKFLFSKACRFISLPLITSRAVLHFML